MGIRFYNLNGFFVKKLAHGVNSSAQPAVRLLKSEGGLLFPAVVRNIHNR